MQSFNHNTSHVVIGGSTTNLANQEFFTSLENTPFEVGDILEVNDIAFQGDFGLAGEGVVMKPNSLTDAQSVNVGFFVAQDAPQYMLNIDGVTKIGDGTTVNVIEQNGQIGVKFFFSPAASVNFDVGILGGLWWRIKCNLKLAE